MEKVLLCSWCSSAPRKDGPIWARNRKVVTPFLEEPQLQINRLGNIGTKRVKHVWRSPTSQEIKKSDR